MTSYHDIIYVETFMYTFKYANILIILKANNTWSLKIKYIMMNTMCIAIFKILFTYLYYFECYGDNTWTWNRISQQLPCAYIEIRAWPILRIYIIITNMIDWLIDLFIKVTWVYNIQ